MLWMRFVPWLLRGGLLSSSCYQANLSLGSNGTKAAATRCTKEAINQILNYCATYPADGILYRSSDMVLCAYSDAGLHNESKKRSRAGAYIILSKNDAMT